jgi:FkbH-like protein
MAKTKPAFDNLLEIRTRAELRAALAGARLTLSLPQAQRLATHAGSLGPAEGTLRLGIIHTYTSNLLDPWLDLSAALHGFELQTYHAPYGTTIQEAHESSGLVKHEPDLTLLMLRREDLHPDFAKPLPPLSPAALAQLNNDVVERLRHLVSRLRAQRVGQIVLTVLPSIRSAGLGMYDAQSEFSEGAWWAGLKADIARCMRESLHATLFVDLDDVLQHTGRDRFFDPRYWYSARFPFAVDAAREIARRVVALGAVIKLPKAKVIVLDADNTLWGGIIGEDGIDGIALGPEYPGNAYMDFQRRILDYRQRGFVVALCSRNNPADVDQVLNEHPHQLLRDEHFAARRVNWLPKPDNLVALADELNVGLESFIFVDDSDHECSAVRHSLPQVEVVQTPGRPVDVPGCLEHVARLEVLSLTAEDRAKTELYAQERRRRELSESVGRGGGDLHAYLAMLKMKIRVSLDAPAHVARVSQLTQKTNQFNLTTRRYNEQQIQELMHSPDWLVADFSLADAFGDSGIVGVALIRMIAPRQAELDTLLMSCRVIGREAEVAFLNAVLRQLVERGATEIVADYHPTAKNELVKNFLPEQGFERCADGRYRRNLSSEPPQPESAVPIAVEVSGASRGAPLAA